MATLTEPEKAEIVRLLACYRTPSRVVVEMRAQGVVVDRFQVRTYDPTNPRFEGGERWRVLFEKERAAYLNEIDDIPIAKPAFRLNILQQNLEAARDAGNLVLANAILKQAAWEVGRIPAQPAAVARPELSPNLAMTPDERRARMAELINEALSRKVVTAADDSGAAERGDDADGRARLRSAA